MYRKNSNDLIKHLDFIIGDILWLLLALCLSFFIKFDRPDFYSNPLYREMAILIVPITVAFAGLGVNYRGILLRGYLIEVRKTAQHVSMILAAYLVYSFLTKRADLLSRELMLWFYLLSLVFMYVGRCLWKKVVVRIIRFTQARKVVLMSDREGAGRLLSEFRQRRFLDFTVVGLFLLEGTTDRTGPPEERRKPDRADSRRKVSRVKVRRTWTLKKKRSMAFRSWHEACRKRLILSKKRLWTN